MLNIEGVKKMAERLNPLKDEGYVVCDKNWRRMKIKNGEYVHRNWFENKFVKGLETGEKIHRLVISGEHKVYI